MLRALTISSLALMLPACGAEEQGTSTYITARVDGVTWRGPASDGQVVNTVEHPDGPGVIYTIASHHSVYGEELLALDLPNPPAVGTYSLGGDSAFATLLSCPTENLDDCAYWRSVVSDPGSLRITAMDTAAGTIAGAFSFHAHFLGDSAGAVKNITAGTFVVRLPVVP